MNRPTSSAEATKGVDVDFLGSLTLNNRIEFNEEYLMNPINPIVRSITLSTVLWCAPPMLYAGDEGAAASLTNLATPAPESTVRRAAPPPTQLSNEQLDSIKAGGPVTDLLLQILNPVITLLGGLGL
jgi:hypothetical protein